jgi:hypothetical protein
MTFCVSVMPKREIASSHGPAFDEATAATTKSSKMAVSKGAIGHLKRLGLAYTVSDVCKYKIVDRHDAHPIMPSQVQRLGKLEDENN